MTDFQERAVLAQRANLDFIFGLAGRMLEGEEKLIRLNLDMTKTTFADWYQRVQDGLARKDGQEVVDLQNTLALPAVEKVLTYQRQVAEVTSALQTQLAEVVNAQYLEVNRQVQWFVENVAQNTPVGAEPAIALMNHGVTLVNTAYENAQKATQQVVDVAQSSISATTEVASEAAEAVDESVEKAAKAAKAAKQ